MIYGKVNYRRPTPEEIELLREPIMTKISFSSKSGNRMSNVLLVVAIISTVFFGLDISIVGGIIIAVAWLSYTSVARYKLKEEVHIVCVECSDSNRLMTFTKEMLKPDVYSWFKY